jgi:hypothetical protein
VNLAKGKHQHSVHCAPYRENNIPLAGAVFVDEFVWFIMPTHITPILPMDAAF